MPDGSLAIPGGLFLDFIVARQSPEQSYTDVEAAKLRAKVEEELADVFIFAIEFANVTGIDIAAIIEAKMKRNAEKYPVDEARGNSAKYTDL